MLTNTEILWEVKGWEQVLNKCGSVRVYWVWLSYCDSVWVHEYACMSVCMHSHSWTSQCSDSVEGHCQTQQVRGKCCIPRHPWENICAQCTVGMRGQMGSQRNIWTSESKKQDLAQVARKFKHQRMAKPKKEESKSNDQYSLSTWLDLVSPRDTSGHICWGVYWEIFNWQWAAAFLRQGSQTE